MITAADLTEDLAAYLESHPGNAYNLTAHFIMQSIQPCDALAIRPYSIAAIFFMSFLFVLSASFLVYRKAFGLKDFVLLNSGLITPNAAHILAFWNLLTATAAIANDSVQLRLAHTWPFGNGTWYSMSIGMMWIPQFCGGWLYVFSTISVYMSSRKQFAKASVSGRRLQAERIAISVICVGVMLAVFIYVSQNFIRFGLVYRDIFHIFSNVSQELIAASHAPSTQPPNLSNVLPYLLPLQPALPLQDRLIRLHTVGWITWTVFGALPGLILAPFGVAQIRLLRRMARFNRCPSAFEDTMVAEVVGDSASLVNEFHALILSVISVLAIMMFTFPLGILVARWHTDRRTLLTKLSLAWSQIGFVVFASSIIVLYYTAAYLRTRTITKPAQPAMLEDHRGVKLQVGNGRHVARSDFSTQDLESK